MDVDERDDRVDGVAERFEARVVALTYDRGRSGVYECFVLCWNDRVMSFGDQNEGEYGAEQDEEVYTSFP